MQIERPDFPFAAIAGQSALKTAVILAAINPSVGGILISGPRGTAKTTLARGLSALLPAEQRHAFVNLPLGASEEMLVGTLDLQQVLNDRQVAYQPGLLAKADGGVLYVDEVNLLPDTLVDLLLDVAASGVNHIERDGISHSHSAVFLLIGTMNPDEGELRPQLKDRFGLVVELEEHYSVEERVEIVRRREAYDADPVGFCQTYQEAQTLLQSKIQAARVRLSQVHCPDTLRAEIAERCFRASVEGVRADLVWYRAALAHAAWCKRTEVSIKDIDAVEALVLTGRTHELPPPSPPSAPDSSRTASNEKSQTKGASHGGFSRPPASKKTSKDREPAAGSSNDAQGSEDLETDWGGMSGQAHAQAIAVSNPHLLLNYLRQQKSSLLQQRSQQEGVPIDRVLGRAGKSAGKRLRQSRKPAWFSTLIANSGVWPPERLRFQKHRSGGSVLNDILTDSSASTLGDPLLGRAKALVLQIAERIYLKREQLTILAFGHGAVVQVLSQRRAPKQLTEVIEAIKAGGGTPLREALRQVEQQQRVHRQRAPEDRFRTWLLTDGRTRQRVDDIELQGECHVIDLEHASVKRGRASEIAQALGGGYLLASGC